MHMSSERILCGQELQLSAFTLLGGFDPDRELGFNSFCTFREDGIAGAIQGKLAVSCCFVVSTGVCT